MTKRELATFAGALAGLALACSTTRTEQRGSPSAQAPADATKAGAGTAQANPDQQAVQEMPEVAGRLTGISGNELRLQPTSGDEVKLKVDPATTSIDLDGRQATLSDLVPGTEVRASYEEERGDKHALAIHAKTGEATTPGAKASETTGAK